MIQVRCPECGYLQTLSEERFLAVPEDFLTCPHCHARVPKEWNPVDPESVPEEARHKILAFSRRILNGRDASIELVHALEALVRHHGPMEGSAKALGIAYARLNEPRKAEAFLIQAQQESPDDPEILRHFLHIRLAENRFEEAVETGQALIDLSGARLEDEDVARLALALLGLNRTTEASVLMDSYPDLDRSNPVVRQARRDLDRIVNPGLFSLLGNWGSLNRLLGGKGQEALKSLTDRTRTIVRRRPSSYPTDWPSETDRTRHKDTEMSGTKPRDSYKLPHVLEYWIYSTGEDVPGWEIITERLARLHSSAEERERTFQTLETLMERKCLTTEYVMRRQVEELFDYPVELIPRNGRGVTDADRKTLAEAQLIARLRLTAIPRREDHLLAFMVRFVEAVRDVTGGVVQDAVSHILWGTEEWRRRMVLGQLDEDLASNVQFEILDEGGMVWIHSHGMQKFGLPDIEMEHVPGELASPALNLMVKVAETLVDAVEEGVLDLNSPQEIPNTRLFFKLEVVPQDEEGHFPAGSLKVLPYAADHDPKSADTLKYVLTLAAPQPPREPAQAITTERVEPTVPTPTRTPADERAVRDRMIEAHRKAKSELHLFKRSFQEGTRSGSGIHAVKVGFQARGGDYEWMWISLDSWRGGSIVGRLANSPVLRKDLRKGSKVQINESEVFDWAISQGGKIVKGAYTETALKAS